jgi:hypothetical protein
MWCGSSISAITMYFVCPARTKLGTAITALEVTSVIKINLNIAGYNIIFISRGVTNPFKVYCGPGLPGSIVSIT